MEFSDEPQRQREFLQPRQAIRHRVDVIRDFADIVIGWSD